MSVFLSFLFFSSTKSENSRVEQAEGEVGRSGEGFGSSGRGEVKGKGFRRVNKMQKTCTYVCKCKNDTC
jgi:hypothetical protein